MCFDQVSRGAKGSYGESGPLLRCVFVDLTVSPDRGMLGTPGTCVCVYIYIYVYIHITRGASGVPTPDLIRIMSFAKFLSDVGIYRFGLRV